MIRLACMATTGLVTLLLLTAIAVAAPMTSSPLIGCWRCELEGEISMMAFRDDNTMISDGELSHYDLTEGSIRMESELGPIDYPYTIEGNTLTLTFMGIIEIPCTRVKCADAQSRVPVAEQDSPAESEVPPPRETPGSGQEYLLQGTLCHWSGSSSSYTGSGYSHSLRVSFDGQGHFATGSESSYSGTEGLAYGSGDGNGGSYRVVGNEVHLQFNDGSQGVATVERRESDGRITALKYEGNLYGPELCD